MSEPSGGASSANEASVSACSWLPAWGPFRTQDGGRDVDDIGPGEGPG